MGAQALGPVNIGLFSDVYWSQKLQSTFGLSFNLSFSFGSSSITASLNKEVDAGPSWLGERYDQLNTNTVIGSVRVVYHFIL